LNHIATLPVRGLDDEVLLCGGRYETSENFGEKSGRMFWIALDERQNDESS
jgi:hypothetical protein